MFVIERGTNSIKTLQRRSFSELGFKERSHLQEWIAGNAEALGEKLLIIQKEFSGFADTYERLDLLALDKNGNLVIIENKLDDSGKDVTWQALKYASYCSTLTKEQIKEIFQTYLNQCKREAVAEQLILDFLEEVDFTELLLNQNQRIILVAANFRKEVTSTVLWLMKFKIKVQCYKATPYELDGQFFLTLDQIIPTKDAQDYTISITNKVLEEITTEEENKSRYKLRSDFWTEFLKAIRGKSTLFQNSNPVKYHWLVAGGTDISHVSYQAIITYSYAAAIINFGRSSAAENKLLFDSLKKHEAEIEISFGQPLKWERLDDAISSRVSFAKPGLNCFNRDEWNDIINFLIENLNKMEKAVKPYLSEIRTTLNTYKKDLKEPIEE